MAIPPHIFEQLNSQADLVSIIGRHTTLKKAGNEYKGCCPFHGEKTPSFYVNPSKNMYHCFGCGVGGNALKFLQEYENLTFLEAVKELSRQTGIEIPEDGNQSHVKYKRQSATVKVNANNNSNSHTDTHARIHTHANNNTVNNAQANNSEVSNIAAQNIPSQHPSSESAPSTVIANVAEYDGYFSDDSYSYDDSYDHSYQQNGYEDYENYGVIVPSGHLTNSNLNGEPQNNLQNNLQTTSPVDEEGDLYELLTQVQAFYQQCLKNNRTALQYFQSRGLTAETIETFGLGYAPSGWQHLENQFPNDIEGLKLLGLVRRSEKGRDYDLLRDRVIFSIRDNQGRVIGFAGRALDNDTKPKYINSSDSPVFHKQHVLYGYYESRQHRAKDWLVVEGYMDVIALYQAGIYGAVASMGTAINETQIARLLNLNPVLTLSFDGDSAGQKAAWRTLEVSLPILTDDKELRFLTLPNQHDPDTYIKEHGVDAMREQIEQATPLSVYVFDYLSGQYNLSQPEGKAKLMSQVRTLTSQLPKGSSFRSLLNNDIYQKLTGRVSYVSTSHHALLDFTTKLTLSISLCLCLLYQPTLLTQNPIEQLWQKSGVTSLNINERVIARLQQDNLDLPKLPSWQDFHDDNMMILIDCIRTLLAHLPKDANTASHFILASLPTVIQQKLTPHWQSFYASLLRDNIIDIEPLFQELLIQQLLYCLQEQHKQTKNIYIRDIINKRRTRLIGWQKSLSKN